MTSKELKLLNSRWVALGIDERQRTSAEQAGSELMEWIEKVRTHPVKLQDDNQTHSKSGISVNAPSMINCSQQTSSVEGLIRNEGPLEVKTAPKSSTLNC
ncbi:hypothetical protein PCANC_21190 [Puccinia coronata f. sp. avenae]|uniref:Uncharacterized protein n=1 Tax=Puccinia coronata f. sp. avenae TaxID=200324 RepID=A0A2N5TY59_9BASI|nr:hypothetical protein PCANC_21190 [Puccinia coronata f. sp. avenae]